MARRTFSIVQVSVMSLVLVGWMQNFSHLADAAQQVTPSAGYRYPVPRQGAASENRPQTTKPVMVTTPSQTHTLPAVETKKQPIPSESQQLDPQVTALQASAATPNETNVPEEHHHHHNPAIEAIDVACGKERMTVRVTFDQIFNGIIYAKGHYSEPGCQFVAPNSTEKMYQFDLTTGQCGVAFIDSGLKEGGQAYVEGLLVIINEPGVQEAWDAARKIRCLWEGNLEQTVTFPLSLNMLDSKLLTFSGDTATVALEIQSGVGPRAPVVQGLVGIGDKLTAVVTVKGDAEFDLLVRNCVATDGTPDNRIILSDGHGCAVRPKLMGGWTKEKSGGSILAFAELSAFKFPDVMDLFLECTVSLCKGECEECPNYLTLHVPNHEGDVILATSLNESIAKPKTKRSKRHSESNQTILEGSTQVGNKIFVVEETDLPSFRISGAAVYGTSGVFQQDCVSLVGIVAAVLTLLMVLTSLAIYGTFRRKQFNQC